MTENIQPNEIVETDVGAGASEATATEAPVVAAALPTESASAAESVAEPASSAGGPALVSLEAMESSKPTPLARLGGSVTQLRNALQGRGWLVVVGLVLIFLLFISIPPISLWAHIADGSGYETLNARNPSLTHPDGLTVKMMSEEVANTLRQNGVAVNLEAASDVRLRLGSVPRADFLNTQNEAVAAARESLPSSLVPKSPYYTLEWRGEGDSPIVLEVIVPNEAEPWETLDLYGWDGAAWYWMPARIDRANEPEVLVAETTRLPSAVMVVQTQPVVQALATNVAERLPTGPTGALTEFNITGMMLGTLGSLVGDPTALPNGGAGGAPLAVVVRNWVPGHAANVGLVRDMLNIEADRVAHVENVTALVRNGGYAGVVLDYRGLERTERETYLALVGALADSLHEYGVWLAVTVETPVRNAEGSWDTGGYAWRGLGVAADQVRVLMPLSPEAYTPGGEAEQLLAWGTTQVSRYSLAPVYTTLSTDGETTLPMTEALPIGDLQAPQLNGESVEPGTALNFQLSPVVSTEVDATTGAAKVLAVGRQIWLGTPQFLRTRLDLAARYHLGAVVVNDILDAGNVPGILEALDAYQAQAPTTTYTLPEIVWQVSGPAGQQTRTTATFDQPSFTWTAPEITGTYRIAVSVDGQERGDVSLIVADSQAVATGETELEDDEPEEPEDDTPATTAGLAAAFVTDVTVPDNTRFEKGESFTKTWRLRNSGSEDWPENTVLVYVRGEQMTSANSVEVGSVAVGAEVDISVEMTAPDRDGNFTGVWALAVGNTQISGGGVTVVIAAGEEQAAPAPAPGPVTPVAGGSFELGGHIRDYAFPYAELMHYSGMNWAKVQVHYGDDPSWLINAAHARGFKIQVSAIGGPGMVTQPGFEQDYANWVASLAAAGADAIEVWNEPNIDREWQIGHISPQAYTNLLCASYRAIKAANPGSAVISAAPAPTGYFGGCGPNGCDDQPWMEGLYNAGAANCMDYIGAHHNAGATAPSARSGHPTGSTHHSWYFLPQTELYYNIFRGQRQVFYTEMGYASQEGVPTFSDAFAWARGINNAQQAAWLAEAASLGANTGMVRCIIVWNIDFVRYEYDPQDGYAIIRPGGGCPACEALHNVLGSR